MKEKLSILFIVILAALCLFGCSEKLPAEEMVWKQSTEDIA